MSKIGIYIVGEQLNEYTREWELPPRKTRGWVHEVEAPMRDGESIAYETEHEEPGGRVVFNIHSHKGRETTYHVKGDDARMAGTFPAPWEGKFYLMWENTSEQAVTLRIRAERAPPEGAPKA